MLSFFNSFLSHLTFSVQYLWNVVRMFALVISWTSLKRDHIEIKNYARRSNFRKNIDATVFAQYS